MARRSAVATDVRNFVKPSTTALRREDMFNVMLPVLFLIYCLLYLTGVSGVLYNVNSHYTVSPGGASAPAPNRSVNALGFWVSASLRTLAP